MRCRPLRGLRVVVAQKLVSNGLNGTTGIYLYSGLFRVVSVFNPDSGVGNKVISTLLKRSRACQSALSIFAFIYLYDNM